MGIGNLPSALVLRSRHFKLLCSLRMAANWPCSKKTRLPSTRCPKRLRFTGSSGHGNDLVRREGPLCCCAAHLQSLLAAHGEAVNANSWRGYRSPKFEVIADFGDVKKQFFK